MPGLLPFLPALELPRFVCRNCGYWQMHFAHPTSCPLCIDTRHVLPITGWKFYDGANAASAFPMHWEELLSGLWRFWNDPVDGIGSHSYFLQHSAGNIVFEGATIYSAPALNFLRSLGGVDYASASHPHTYGALWQLQETFGSKIALQTCDLGWASAFRVTHPFEAELEVFAGVKLIHAGVHFAGQSFLFDEPRGVLFCGDALKFELNQNDSRLAVAISTHKSFVRGVPITPQEARAYHKTFRGCKFEKTYTPFEQVHNVGSEIVERFLLLIQNEYPQPNFVSVKSILNT